MSAPLEATHLRVLLPGDVEGRTGGEIPTREKTALYISTQIRDQIPTTASPNNPGVRITSNPLGILRAISQHGQIARRYPGEGEPLGLENDPDRQQVIVYMAVCSSDHVLLYQRASDGDVSAQQEALLGDKRLRGRWSIGFGGHSSEEDARRFTMIESLLPGFQPELEKVLALEVGRIAELAEELGLADKDIARLQLGGVFYQTYEPSQLADSSNIPVSAVHTAMPAVAVLDPERVRERGLYLPRVEFARAEWVPVVNIVSRLEQLVAEGHEVEPWTRIMATDFLQVPVAVVERPLVFGANAQAVN